MIELNQVALQRGAQLLLNNANLRIHDGQKLALIGANGAGKSSLFALLTKQLELDAGELLMPAKWRIAHMQQEVLASERSALDYSIDGDTYLREIEQGIEQAKNDNELTYWLDKMDAHQGYQVPVKAEQLLQGLGFKHSDLNKPVASFSGGWRIRLNLAQALMMPSDLLLLDEPTNHLDLEATLWLEQWLKRYQGTLLFISHDRDFIDGVADNIIHLQQQSLTVYPGNYSTYERTRAEKLAQQQQAFAKQQVRIKEIEQFVARFRAKASKAKQAQSRLKELERMQQIAPAHVDSPFSFSFPCYSKLSTPLLTLSNANLGYRSNAPIVQQVTISITPEHRVGLLGPNGAGKSTLLKTLCDELAILSGEKTAGEHLRIGYFAQHQLEALDTKASAMLILQRLKPTASEQAIRNFLGGFDFNGDKALEIIEPFSGGEKARLALACVAWQEPNLLILDEPTNHLDIEMREALTMALQNFNGAIILVSHDRHLLKATLDEYWLIDKGQLIHFNGNLDDYHKYANKGELPQGSAFKELADAEIHSVKPSIATQQERKQQKQQQAAQRQKLAPLKKEQQQLEARIEQAQKAQQKLIAQLADNDLYQAENSAQLKPLLQQQTELTQELEQLEQRWLELIEEIENK